MNSKNLLEPVINKLQENRNTVVQITIQDHPLHVVNVGKSSQLRTAFGERRSRCRWKNHYAAMCKMKLFMQLI